MVLFLALHCMETAEQKLAKDIKTSGFEHFSEVIRNSNHIHLLWKLDVSKYST